MSWRALRLAREEPDQVLRLQAFRAAHPEVIIGDGGFGVWQARIPEPDGEQVISRYTSANCSTSLASSLGSAAPSSSKDMAQPPVANPRQVGDKEAAPAQPVSQVSQDSRHARSSTWIGSPVRKRLIASAASRIFSSSCSLWIGSQTKMTMLSWTNV